MAIDLQNGYPELRSHIGHEIVCVAYSLASDLPPENVALECETCGCVLLDFDHPDE